MAAAQAKEKRDGKFRRHITKLALAAGEGMKTGLGSWAGCCGISWKYAMGMGLW